MCGKNPDVNPAVNSAKCWAIPGLVFAILSCIGFLAYAWIQGVGGILACVGTSIVICCGPEKGKPGGDGKMMAAFVLMLIGAIVAMFSAAHPPV